jgi:LysM repeat protein
LEYLELSFHINFKYSRHSMHLFAFFLFLPKLIFILMRKQLVYILLLPLIVSSCRSARQAIQPSAGEPNAAAYIAKYKDLAVSEMRRTGVPASITLAQGMIESDFGRSTLAREGNNHFGIKCHDDWTGPTIRHHDDRRNECFRKYSRPEDSFYDHSDFLRNGSRYNSLFDIDVTDYKGWAKGLKKAGYATNPNYANMLIREIEENNLQYYDYEYLSDRQKMHKNHMVEEVEKAEKTEDKSTEGTSDSIAPKQSLVSDSNVVPAAENRIMENNRIQYIIVKDGETRERIEKEFKLLRWELARYNELSEDFVPVSGQMLYLQPKRDKAEPGKEVHIVSQGDTMYTISQQYGIKKAKLYEKNRMTEGEEPMPGTKLWLRTMKPVN